MEYLIIVCLVLICTIIYVYRQDKNTIHITRIDKETWMVDGKVVDLSDNTSLDTFKQRQEDDRHYYAYEKERLDFERRVINNEWTKTVLSIGKYPELMDCITKKGLESITGEYNKYVFKCARLHILIPLTKEQFLVRKIFPAYCRSFNLLFPKCMMQYTIYNKETARYVNGNMLSIMQEEFEKKWY
jgi:hypothetical protein